MALVRRLFHTGPGLFLGFLLATLLACAAPQVPSGGPKDTTPPRIIAEESTANRQTRFQDRQIVVTFDEWVQLKDVYTQLIVSPPMPAEPEVKLKGKSLVIALPDSLRPQTTYTLHFGNAIADLNENNVLENFSFVFSTGERLDSASMSGTVIDAVTLKPAEGIWVMLYPFAADSAVYLRKPDYLSKTDKSGKWSIANIRPDTFRVIALKDANLNYLLDQSSEWVGWYDEPVITADEITLLPDLLISAQDLPLRITEAIHSGPGWIKLVMPGLHGLPEPDFEPGIPVLRTEVDKDTLHFFYDAGTSYTGQVILEGDTTRIRAASGNSYASRALRVQPQLGRVFPGSPIEVLTDVPLADVDSTRINLEQDTLGSLPVRVAIDSIQGRKARLSAAWRSPGTYRLTFLGGALTDVWGRTNDSLSVKFNMPGFDAFGEMILVPQGLDSTRQYLVTIKSGEQALAQHVVSGVTTTSWRKPGLPPSKLTVEIVEDLNANGRWDPGSYPDRRQPEPRKLFTPDQLRAGWEVEVELRWK